MCLASALSVIWRKGVQFRGVIVGMEYEGELCSCVKCSLVKELMSAPN